MSGRLHYFDAGGRAESIRALLAHANFQYEDVRLTAEQFGAKALAGEFPLGSVPVWEEEGRMVPVTNCILRMLGIRLGYYSEDPLTMWAIDSICDWMEDISDSFYEYLMPIMMGGQITLEGSDEWVDNFWDNLLTVVNNRLADTGAKFIAGT